jgi:hypothetical protein
MPVPEAPVNHKNRSVARENNVWLARKVAAMQPVAVSEPMKDAPDGKFRRGVARANSGHHGASLRVDSRI